MSFKIKIEFPQIALWKNPEKGLKLKVSKYLLIYQQNLGQIYRHIIAKIVLFEPQHFDDLFTEFGLTSFQKDQTVQNAHFAVLEYFWREMKY
jgi:hypothetical protein